MKVLTDTLCKEHYDLYTEIHGSIAVSQIRVAQKDFSLLSSHGFIELAQKYIILLSEFSIVIHKAGKCTSVEKTKFIHFNLSGGT